jgi:hypothetical protein
VDGSMFLCEECYEVPQRASFCLIRKDDVGG